MILGHSRHREVGALQIEAFGKAYPATRGPRVLYDPKMEGLKG